MPDIIEIQTQTVEVTVADPAVTVEVLDSVTIVEVSNDRGLQGASGVGVPTGGSAGQILTKIDGDDYHTEWVDPAVQNASLLTLPAGESLGGHRAVRVQDGQLWYSSADEADHAIATVGITIGAASLGADANAVIQGSITEPSWNWTPGPVYLGLGGLLTQTPPSSGTVLQIGVAESATTILVSIKQPIRKA